VGVVSRGYGAGPGAVNDEALELAQKLPEITQIQNPDRVAGAWTAIERFGCEVLVVDDGFQHRRLARDLDIVLLDALEPFGFGHVFPRGTLREPPAGLRRAQVVVLSRADLATAAQRDAIRREVQRYAPEAAWCEAVHAVRGLRSASGGEASLDVLKGRPVAAFCGVGNPAGFRHTLERCGCRIVDFREFPDHFAYPAASRRSLCDWADGLPIEAVVCTGKDLVKWKDDRLGRHALWALTIGTDFLAGRETLERALGILSKPSP
jgi:tetraacyldisaccharide 4'-kinase